MKTKWWALIFAGALVVCAAAAFFLMRPASGQRAGVFLDGELIREIDLSAGGEAYEFTVSSQYGENTVRVESGEVYIISSDCSGGECLRHSPLPEGASPIVCLPHRLVIRMLSDTDRGYDIMTGTAAS